MSDRVVSLSVHARLTLYVDDATLETVCTRARIVHEHVKAARALTSGLQDSKLMFSDKQNVV